MSALEDDVRRLGDIQEIVQLKARCCRLIDTKDWDGYGELLVDDFRLTSDGGTRTSRAEVLSSLAGSLATATTVHHVHMPEITVSGDTATAIWAMNDYVMFPGEGSPFVIRGYGHYHEEYVANPRRLAGEELGARAPAGRHRGRSARRVPTRQWMTR